MRHRVFGKKLSRTANERRRLFRGLANDLIIQGRIRTTFAKAKAVQPLVERLITKARIGTEAKRREILAVLSNKEATRLLMKYAKEIFVDRTSGFTQIIKLGRRRGDNTEEALLQFVDALLQKEEKQLEKKQNKKKSIKESKRSTTKKEKST